MSLYGIWNPEAFQGSGRKKNYFEGWYYKLIDKGNADVLGIIPGISLGSNRNESHAFIQIIDAAHGQTYYLPFPIETFSADKKRLKVEIGNNLFQEDRMVLDVRGKSIPVRADLQFDRIEKYPSSIFSPGIMGPFSFVPFMECHHGIINMRHRIHGKMLLGERMIDFEEGEGYVEKDWGTSFPGEWIWAQANHFEDPKTSFMFSLASIPFLGGKFRGLISYLAIGKRLHRFTTYNLSRICELDMDEDSMKIALENMQSTLSVRIKRAQGYSLKAPAKGRMVKNIEETIDAYASLTLLDKKGKLLFEGNSPKCGLEISENAELLL